VWLSRSSPDEEPWQRGKGRAELAAAWDALMDRRPPGGRQQLTLDPLVALDGDRATALSYFVCIGNETGEAVLLYSGEYRDRLVREADGGWRLAERLILSGAPAQAGTLGALF
jgi:hypothetical protein